MLLTLAIIFLVIGLAAFIFGFRGIASCSFAIAKFFGFVFLALFLILLVLHLMR